MDCCYLGASAKRVKGESGEVYGTVVLLALATPSLLLSNTVAEMLALEVVMGSTRT